MNARIDHIQSCLGTVLVVDDDPMVTGMFAVGLEPDYRVQEANHPWEALAWLELHQPDVILMDIGMPGMNGFEACLKIRNTPELAAIPVIFVSSHDTLEERLQAFDVGADDFVIKPFELEEVSRKIARAVKLKAGHWQLAQEKSAAEGAAQTALTLLAEMGLVLNFTRSCLSARSFVSLADQTIDTCASMGLNAHVQIRSPLGTITRTGEGEASALEESIFERTREIGRLFSFRRRMICNYDNFSVLISNMPLDDPELCGRIRDHAAMIGETGSAAVASIELRLQVEAAARELQLVSAQCHDALGLLRNNYRQQQGDTRCELEGMVERVERMYMSMGLTDGQEHAISDTVRAAADQVLGLFRRGMDFEGEFESILAHLDQAASLRLPEEEVAETRTEVW